jgi:uncharacterized protein
MKYLLVLLVLVVAFWLWRNNRRSEQQAHTPPRSQPPAASPVAMIACSQCGTHVPQAEVIEGVQGRYCCPEHRRQHEAGVR